MEQALTEGRGKGRLVLEDARDREFPLQALLKRRTAGIKSKFWWANGWWGNQGDTSQCVAYSWLHWTEDGPVTHPRSILKDGARVTREFPLVLPQTLYCEAQALDPWPGDCSNPQYDGSTIRAGAKALVARGLIEEYRWAWDIGTITDWLLTKGPLIVGTSWFSGMEEPDEDGFIWVQGANYGGHAYKLDGVSLYKGEEYYRIKNSWSRNWGGSRNKRLPLPGGFARISAKEFGKLIADPTSEACVAVEKRAA